MSPFTSFVCLALFASGAMQGAAPGPNVLFIAVDDLENELGCDGARVSLLTALRLDSSNWDPPTEMHSVIPDLVTLPRPAFPHPMLTTHKKP